MPKLEQKMQPGYLGHNAGKGLRYGLATFPVGILPGAGLVWKSLL